MRQLSTVAILLLLFFAQAANAVPIASDDAADPAYAAGWQNGSNGGLGFKPWGIVANDPDTQTGHFIGDASTNGCNGSGAPGSSGGVINTDGKSFELFAEYVPAPELGGHALIG